MRAAFASSYYSFRLWSGEWRTRKVQEEKKNGGGQFTTYKSEERDLSDVSIRSVQTARGGDHTCTSTCAHPGIKEGRDRVGSIVGSRALSALIRHQTEGCCAFIAPLSIIVSFKMYYIGWRGSSLTSHHIHMGGRELGIVRRLGNCVDRGCLARERRRQREDERARLHRKSCATGRLPRRRHKLDVIATASYSPSSLSRTVSWLVNFVLH